MVVGPLRSRSLPVARYRSLAPGDHSSDDGARAVRNHRRRIPRDSAHRRKHPTAGGPTGPARLRGAGTQGRFSRSSPGARDRTPRGLARRLPQPNVEPRPVNVGCVPRQRPSRSLLRCVRAQHSRSGDGYHTQQRCGDQPSDWNRLHAIAQRSRHHRGAAAVAQQPARATRQRTQTPRGRHRPVGGGGRRRRRNCDVLLHVGRRTYRLSDQIEAIPICALWA